MDNIVILGIETSCDETGIAIYDGKNGLLAHQLYSQITTHAPHGGVVPELAARDHIQKIVPLVDDTFKQAKLDHSQITAIAYTAGPGLAGPLLVGALFAQSLAFAWQKPTVPTHHLEGHLLSPFLESSDLNFPFLALLVSGGHTLLTAVSAVGQYQILGESLDDAAGEAFDKIAKMLHLGYPGGARLAQLASTGNPKRFALPRPLTDKPGCHFSFSGLKTATSQLFKNLEDTEQNRADIACAFQEAITDTLILKCQRALEETGYSKLVIAGGVGANQMLRQKCEKLMKQVRGKVYFPPIEFCTDNGAMIAYAGYQRWKLGQYSTSLAIQVRPRWPLKELV